MDGLGWLVRWFVSHMYVYTLGAGRVCVCVRLFASHVYTCVCHTHAPTHLLDDAVEQLPARAELLLCVCGRVYVWTFISCVNIHTIVYIHPCV